MKLNKNKPYNDGRKSNGGARIGSGRKKINDTMVYVNVPILVPKNDDFDIGGFRCFIRNEAMRYLSEVHLP